MIEFFSAAQNTNRFELIGAGVRFKVVSERSSFLL